MSLRPVPTGTKTVDQLVQKGGSGGSGGSGGEIKKTKGHVVPYTQKVETAFKKLLEENNTKLDGMSGELEARKLPFKETATITVTIVQRAVEWGRLFLVAATNTPGEPAPAPQPGQLVGGLAPRHSLPDP